MHTPEWPCLASAKTRSCRDHPRFLAFPLEVLITCLVTTMPIACQPSLTSIGSSMQPNSTLLFNQTLLSSGGVFELGFFYAARSGVSSPVSTVAIWYAHTTGDRTLVWVVPNRSLALSENASLSFSSHGDLQLYDNTGSPRLMWTSNTAEHNGTVVAMLDTGNLVILNSTNHVVWQSFDSPTDTLLPNQRFAANSGVTMKSWYTEYDDWRVGTYSLEWDGASTLHASRFSNFSSVGPYNSSYWSFPTPSSSAYLTTQGEFVAVSKDSGLDTLIAVSASGAGVPNRLLRLTLNPDGVLRMYSFWNGSLKWEIEWESMDDICTISGICGPFAICIDQGLCTCPEGFHFSRTDSSWPGCARIKAESTLCAINTMVSLENTDYLYYDNSTVYKNITVDDCIQNCLSDCSCVAASVFPAPAEVATECWLKNNILLNGQSLPNHTTYLRATVPQKSRKAALDLSESTILKLVASTLGAGILILALLVSVFCRFCIARKVKKSRLERLQKKWANGKDAVVVRFTFKEVKLITNKFAMEIGKGGFGTVFKGQIGPHDNLTFVAVKRLDKLANGEEEFVNEVDIIGQIHHFHLVHLLGYCAEAEHRILVYEYVEEGSLDRLLFRTHNVTNSPVLEWRLRFKIAVQTARALAYLHDDCDQRIVHCDVKPENILLDSMYRAKVADFGLSRIMNREQTQTITTQVRGTRGYLGPEWMCHEMPITAKTDVFSYGMVLLELISGRRNLRLSSVDVDDSDDAYFPIWAYPYIETSAFMDVVDPALTRIANPGEVQRALLVAFWCINDKLHLRPSMVQVIQMLEGHVPVEVPVPRPEFFSTLVTKDSDDDRGSRALHGSQLSHVGLDHEKPALLLNGDPRGPMSF